jgi:hypothetical protein
MAGGSRAMKDFIASKKKAAEDKMDGLLDNYPDGAGRSAQKYSTYGLYLMWPRKGGGYVTRGIVYTWIDEEPCFDNPNDGKSEETITFGYSTATKVFKVTITGLGLTPVYDALMEAKRKIIRISADKTDTPFVGSIKVEEIEEPAEAEDE